MTNKNNKFFFTALCASLLLFAGVATAATLTGTVTNGTTNKPSAGDDVILIELAAGMEQAAQAKTDAQGHFSLKFDDEGAPHLVRVIHQGVMYHQPAPPGTKTADVTVYDASSKVAGVKAVADLMYLQASKGELAVMRLFAVDNTSQPPRTQMNDADFEFYVPEGAEIEDAQAQTAGGQWVNSAPSPQKEKNRYAFVFPIRPGQTQFRVTYHVAYTGKATVNPREIYPLQHFVAIMPRTLGFSPGQTGIYQDKQPPDLPDAIAEVASSPTPGQNLAFEISGEGTLQDQNQNASGTTSAPAAEADNRPGGGLGRPGDDPDPMDQFRWWLLGALGIVLAGGAVYISSRPRALAASSGGATVEVPAALPAPKASAGNSGVLLDALKDELFQLEIERQKGQISDEEYARTKAALDQTLARAIKRNK
ncbi:MAG TPA: hypothetical protein VLW06_07860 [Terriglobales bacterium]|nr:hypothetical protein [Terriglobales bacterium]